jgi:hypothetical protein
MSGEVGVIRVFAAISFVALLSGVAVGQSAGSAPTFDVADVHASARTTTPFVSGGALLGGRYELHKATMVDLIRFAYDVDADKVLGGPSWVGNGPIRCDRPRPARDPTGDRPADAPGPAGGPLQTCRP